MAPSADIVLVGRQEELDRLPEAALDGSEVHVVSEMAGLPSEGTDATKASSPGCTPSCWSSSTAGTPGCSPARRTPRRRSVATPNSLWSWPDGARRSVQTR